MYLHIYTHTHRALLRISGAHLQISRALLRLFGALLRISETLLQILKTFVRRKHASPYIYTHTQCFLRRLLKWKAHVGGYIYLGTHTQTHIIFTSGYVRTHTHTHTHTHASPLPTAPQTDRACGRKYLPTCTRTHTFLCLLQCIHTYIYTHSQNTCSSGCSERSSKWEEIQTHMHTNKHTYAHTRIPCLLH